MKRPRILIVEDEHALALAFAAAGRHAGAESDLAPSAAKAGDLLEENGPYDAMVLDIGLPDRNGLEFLAALDSDRRPPTVVVTAHGEIHNTIEARKLGVVSFLTKPLDFDEFRNVLVRLIRPPTSSVESGEELPPSAAYLGAAASMRSVFQQIAHSCASDDPVLVRGDTGTGKSHTARLIQEHSSREGSARTFAPGPATTPEELSAAVQGTEGGVLILEEISLLSPKMQAELVRQIEAGVPERFPRLIATTRDDLRAKVHEGQFRSDLFYRLQVLEVRLPRLSDRMEDLPALVAYFIGQLAPDRMVEISAEAQARLSSHDWPGSLRELRNAVAYALTVSSGATQLEPSDLPPYLSAGGAGGSVTDEQSVPADLVRALDTWLDGRLGGQESPTYRELAGILEATLIRRLLDRYDGKLSRLAADLQANRTTLRRRLQEG